MSMIHLDIARCYGKSVTSKAVRHVFSRTINPDIKLILDTLAARGDPEQVHLSGFGKISDGGNGQTFRRTVAIARFPSINFPG